MKRTDLVVAGRRIGRRPLRNSRWLGWIVGTLVVLLGAGDPAFGQFLVQPMKMQLAVRPGRRILQPLAVENQSRNTTVSVGLRIVDVSQDPNGIWKDIAPGDPNVDVSNLRSCRSWLRLEKDVVDLSPLQRASARLLIEVPAGVRGYYFAAVLAQSQVNITDVTGFTSLVLLQYVVPIILEVQGLPMRQEVELADVGLEFQVQTGTRPAATLATMDIQNNGGTYSRLLGMTRVWQQLGGHWQRVSETKFLDTGIIPGVKLHLKEDIGKPLPSGTYKVQGFLIVDGRRSDQIEKQFNFSGDPRIRSTSVDAALEVDPVEQYLQMVPGSTRTTTITVVNPSDEPVIVNADIVLPDHMVSAVSAGGTRGEDFGCARWTRLDPAQFTLVAHGRTNLRVTSQMPSASSMVMLPDYYGVIRLFATYPDGQKGGLTKARLCIQNRSVAGTPHIDSMVFTVADLSASRYLVTARFQNSGDIHVQPVCRAILTTLPGAPQKRIILSSDAWDQTGVLLPMETRNFSGVLDISDVGPGTYRLTAVLEYQYDQETGAVGFGKTTIARGEVQTQMALDVVEEGAGRVIKVNDIDKVGKVQISL